MNLLVAYGERKQNSSQADQQREELEQGKDWDK